MNFKHFFNKNKRINSKKTKEIIKMKLEAKNNFMLRLYLINKIYSLKITRKYYSYFNFIFTIFSKNIINEINIKK